MLATAPAAHYAEAMRILLADPGVDALLTIFIPPLVTAAVDVAAVIKDVAATASKPVLATFMAAEAGQAALHGVPTYPFPEAGVTALARAVEYAAWRRRPEGAYRDFTREVSLAQPIVRSALARGDGWLTPIEAQSVLDAMQIPAIRTFVVSDADEAAATAAAAGYPVALKAFGPAILHKSDANAVRLGLADEAAVRAAFADLRAHLGTRMIGVLVQAMASGGVEMFVGGLQDPAFGPVVFCGSGGVLVELFGDATCRLCPVSSVDVDAMLQEVRGARRLRGYRGAAPADEAAFKEIVWRVSGLLHACPEILELDLNPVSVFVDRAAALDVRIRVAPARAPQPSRRVRY
jgi:acyl-CoA synthetase (NDP forming)